MIHQAMFRSTKGVTNALLFLAVAVSPCLAAASARTAPDRPPCAANAHGHGLDFWLGDWKITDGEQPGYATSVVSLELGKCLVVENWNDGAGHRGQNLFGYNVDSKTWSGIFADNRGRIHIFDHGTVAAGNAEFYGASDGPNGRTILNRISIVRMRSGNVEQTWQQSADNGTTWTTVFQGKYSRAKP
jgi:hypothetical protein